MRDEAQPDNLKMMITLVWGVLIIGLLGFAAIAYLVSTDATIGFDQTVMAFFVEQGQTPSPLGPAWIEEIFLELTALGGGTVLTPCGLVGIDRPSHHETTGRSVDPAGDTGQWDDRVPWPQAFV